MEKEEKNGGENPNSTQEDNTFVILDPGPGTAPDMPKQNGSTTLPTTASPGEALKLKSNERPGTVTDMTEQNGSTTLLTTDSPGETQRPGTALDMTEQNGSTTLLATDSPGETQRPGTATDMPEQNGSTSLLITDSPGEALKLKSNGRRGTAPDMPEQNESTTLPTTASPGEAQRPGTVTDMTEQNGSTTLPTTASPGEAQRPGTAPDMPEQNGSTSLPTTATPGEAQRPGTAPDMKEQNGSTTLPTTASPGEAQRPGTAPDMPEQNGSTTLPTTDSPGEALKLKSNEINEQMKEPQATALDNGASQGGEEFQIAVDIKSGKTDVSLKIVKPNNPGDNRAPPLENKHSGSENQKRESGFSGHAGGKDVEVTEAQTRDANGRSEKEMKTDAGANEDDAKEGRPMEEKATGEGVEGGGGTADAVKTRQHVIKERSVSISICSSAYSFNVEGLVSYLNRLMKKHPELIKKVKFHELPYNDLDHYQFNEENPVDVMILCHSINNRRFAITNVMDALYDEYLPYCARVVGKEKMGVIVHDFDDMRETVQSSRMSSFKYKQPKAFETTSLQIACGHIEKEEQVLKQMLKEDRKRLLEFLKNASKNPEKTMNQRDIETNGQKVKWMKKQASDLVSSIISSVRGGNEVQRSSTQPAAAISPKYPASDVDTGEIKTEERFSDGRKNDDSQPTKRARVESQPSSPNVKRTDSDSGGDVAQVRQQSLSSQSQMPSSQPTPLTEPRSTSVSICSSAYQHNVNGLLSWLTNFKAKHPHMINDVRFRSLPYNDIDSFRFPTNDPVDVMLLCHSVQNRGFSITNVLNALYEKYLKYCHDVIGKKKLAVIVHDFTDLKPSTVESRMESFRRSQPWTFDFVDTAIICGSLEDPAKLGMRKEDETRLICFLERARFVPEENTEPEQSLVEKLMKYISS